MRALTVRYLTVIPRKPLPADHVVVHNFPPGSPDRALGDGGFRAWIAAAGDEYLVEPCNCGWAPRLGTHYTTIRQEGAE
jgi:hypothetical protein